MRIENDTSHSCDLAVIIPFYNEEKRILPKEFTAFAAQYKNILMILINDNSKDKTLDKLKFIQSQVPENISVLNLERNYGKGNCVREAILAVQSHNIPFIGYLDADLSTSFESFLKLYLIIKENRYDAVFGSRIKKIDTVIHRTLFRHLAGRLVATIVDSKFKIGCYDTQCGAKVFKNDIIASAIEQPFFTRWLFDVEIILRLKKIG